MEVSPVAKIFEELGTEFHMVGKANILIGNFHGNISEVIESVSVTHNIIN